MKYDKRMYNDSNRYLIALDIDGVLGNWDGHVDSLNLRNKNIDSFDYAFWSTIPLFPWAKDLYYSLQNVAPVVLLTSPSNNPDCCKGKHEWINKHFKTRDFLIGGCKWACANEKTLLIDDSNDKIERFKMAGGKTIIFIEDYGKDIPKFISKVREKIYE